MHSPRRMLDCWLALRPQPLEVYLSRQWRSQAQSFLRVPLPALAANVMFRVWPAAADRCCRRHDSTVHSSLSSLCTFITLVSSCPACHRNTSKSKEKQGQTIQAGCCMAAGHVTLRRLMYCVVGLSMGGCTVQMATGHACWQLLMSAMVCTLCTVHCNTGHSQPIYVDHCATHTHCPQQVMPHVTCKC
jgi:hypothetical protein